MNLIRRHAATTVLLLIALCVLLGIAVYEDVSSALHTSSCGALLTKNLSCSASVSDATLTDNIQSAVLERMKSAQAEGKISDTSIYYTSLDTNQWFSINGNKLFQPASLSKVPILMWILSKSENDKSILTDRVTYTEAGPQMPQHFDYGGITPGNTYTVDDLLKSMIINSDNNAAFALFALLSPDDQTQLLSDFDFRKPTTATSSPLGNGAVTSSQEYRADAKTISEEYRALYTASYLTPEDSENVLELLSETKFDKGLSAGVPVGVRVAHKFGERKTATNQEQIHDCGIVYATRPYVLCVMTRGTDPDVLASVIADISKSVYSVHGK